MSSFEIMYLIDNIVNDFNFQYDALDNYLDSLRLWVDEDVKEIIYPENIKSDSKIMYSIISGECFVFVEESEYKNYNTREGREIINILYNIANFSDDSFKRLNSCLSNLESFNKKKIANIYNRSNISDIKKYINIKHDFIQEKYKSILSKYIDIFVSKIINIYK